MSPTFVQHLQHNWPLTIIVIGLAIYLPIVLVTGVFPTNQGSIRRSRDRSGYWRWVGGFAVILAVSITILAGSWLLSPA